MQQPLLDYRDERRFWYCDQPTIYIAYVSKDANYGIDLSLWPESFQAMVEAYLAKEIAGSLTNGDDKVILAEKMFAAARTEARSKDAMKKPTAFTPPGTWSTARGNARTRWNGDWR
jgi:hypothetical protein